MAFVLGILLLLFTAVTEIAKDGFAFEWPLWAKYVSLAVALAAFVLDHYRGQDFEIAIAETDWQDSPDGHVFTIPASMHQKGRSAVCRLYRQTDAGRELVHTGVKTLDGGDIVVNVSLTPNLIAVIS